MPVILKDNKKTVKEYMYSHDYGNGLKLMEHSYIGNNFVGTFENRLIGNPQRVAWAGDYADECKGMKSNLYMRCKDSLRVIPKEMTPSENEFPFVINHTKKQFVDKRKSLPIPNWGAKIHPLPLLTCEGNGRGGGDFRGENEFVGAWARDLISVDVEAPKGFEEIISLFMED
jgi:hypothetical protein